MQCQTHLIVSDMSGEIYHAYTEIRFLFLFIQRNRAQHILVYCVYNRIAVVLTWAQTV